MKKVELITMQRVPNYGSVLQAYATQQSIQKLGYDCELINYYPERMHTIGMLRRIRQKNQNFQKSLLLTTVARIIILPSYFLRFRTFRKFNLKYLKMTHRKYVTLKELQDGCPEADIYCTGSDQVWNSGWNEGIDRAFFLDFAPNNKKKIAYSASFGKSSLDEWEKKETKWLLDRYSWLSLRENSGVEILNNLGIYGAKQVVDPTLLLNSSQWKQISSNRFKEEKYILVYNLNRNPKIDKYARNLSKKTGLKVKYISYQLHEFYKFGKMYCNTKVEDFLSLIEYATYVITDSFHATAFSLNFNTEFVIVYPNKYSSRLQSILNLLNLENRVAKDENDLDVVKNKIDFDYVNLIIQQEREKSLIWLRNALEH